ncbi:lysylphosphatidylglycerol synthase domain-containing protein [Knoellia sinensis]|uniref:lysylphosphatidylglycerol synthase domain-containing protein n=1 Tax=Knoellia sinensis TaxID=136100 RepID=UPI00055A0D77|nr:lysylphosphatidylglycerol synthase domain-containing protein [Knoellia sinensis]
MRPLGGAAILAALVAQLGGAAVIEALHAIEPGALVLGTALAAVTTVGAAWRWKVVAEHLRVGLPLSSATAACYRSQFLNLTLPGGVVGDVERGLRHGRRVDAMGRAVRAVVWERVSNQVVLAAFAVAALVVADPFDVTGPAAKVGLVAVGIVLLLIGGAWAVRHDLSAPLARVLVASVVVVVGHVATFLIAARTVGVSVEPGRLVPLALVVLLLAGLPLSLAGWGPREGAAAWAFAATGATASQGLAVAVAYGVIVTVANLPGAVVLLLQARRSRIAGLPSPATVEVSAHG